MEMLCEFEQLFQQTKVNIQMINVPSNQYFTEGYIGIHAMQIALNYHEKALNIHDCSIK